MTPFDDIPPQKLPTELNEPEDLHAEPALTEQPLAGDPLSSVPAEEYQSPVEAPTYAPDLQITWSWPHLILFLVFSFVSLVLVQGVLAVYYMPKHEHLGTKELEQYLISKPQFAIGSMLIWYATIFFFLYVTLSLLRGHSFWECLGWRKIKPGKDGKPRNPFIFFLAGGGLSLFVAVLTSQVKAPENAPIEELFKSRETAILFMAMAVLVAPLVEETLFRGYLYPLFARSFGIAPGIIVTGVLFGLMHGYQLGWTWSIVAVLILVGIVFTSVRARTGSVFASYMMHLGYNSLISIAALVGTHGFTKMPSQ
jgi:membrane protease YdiL (CAAX protease family)